jgi:type I restriction enzyme S subunit
VIADLKPYTAYKESGLPWLGQVPEHWDSERAKWLFIKMNRPVRDEDEVVTCFRDGVVTLRKNRRLTGFTEATAFSGYQGIRKGDLVIHGMDAFAGAIGVSDSDGKGTPVYNVCQPRPGVNAKYYAGLVRQMSQSQWILSLAKGIRERSTDFRFETFGNQVVPLPSLDEQAAIVQFLDWANGRLERAIRAKRKVIGLLNEQKQAIIHRAVTRGLDSTVALKPSGISWIGDIPEHWEARKLRQLLSRVTERNRPDLALLSVVREKGVIERDTEDRDGNHNFIPEDLSNYKVVRTGQFAMNKMKAWQGSYGVSPFDGIVSPAYFVFNLRGAGGAFFHTAIRSKAYVPFFTQASDGVRVGQWDLAEPRMKEITFFFPSEAEQVAIVDFVTRETTGISVAISQLEREIELLREYRTRLVADVVTGKLDVREAAAQLPDEVLPDTNADAADPGDDLEIADEEATA